MIFRLSAICCIVLMVFTLSCSKNTEEAPPTQPPGTVNPPPPPPPPPVTQPVINDTASILYIAGGPTGHFWAVNASNGTFRWSKSLPCGTEASPLLYDNRLYIACTNSRLYSFDTAGNELWNVTLQGTLRNQSPIGANGKIYINTNSHVYCIEPTNGSITWTFSGIMPSSVPLTSFKGDIYYQAPTRVYRLDGATGAKKWESANIETNFLYSAPAVTDSFVYFQREWGSIGALRTATGQQLWTTPTNSPGSVTSGYTVGINVKDSNVYVLTGHLRVYNAVTGALRYTAASQFVNSFNWGPDGDGVAPVIADNHLIVAGYVPEVYNPANAVLLRTLPSRTEGVMPETVPVNGVTAVGDICYYTTRSGSVITPQLGILYRSYIYAVNYKTGVVLWKVETTQQPWYTAPVVLARSGRVYRGGKGLLP